MEQFLPEQVFKLFPGRMNTSAMNNKYTFLISFLILACLPGHVINGQEPAQWTSLVSEKFHFGIDFPAAPFEETDTVETEAGEMLLHILELDCSEKENYSNLVYMVNCTVYPQVLIHSDYVEILDDFFSGAIHGAVSNISGELLSLQEVKYKDYPGREVRISSDEGLTLVISRLFLIESSFFMMIILTDMENDNNPNIHKFFDSFRYF